MSDEKFVEETPVELRTKKRATQTQYEEKLLAKNLNYDGSIRDPGVPIDPPVGWNPQPSLFETIRNLVRDENLRRDLEAQGLETFDEADDFDVPEDPFPQSQYEVPSDLEPVPPPPKAESSSSPDPVESTGVPLPSGEGEGARGDLVEPPDASASAREARQAAEAPRSPPKGPPSKTPPRRPQR